MTGGVHTLMKDADNRNAITRSVKINHVLPDAAPPIA